MADNRVVLVNNAGPMLVKPLFDTTPGEWEWMIRSNLSSAFPYLGCGLLHHRHRAPGPWRALDTGINFHLFFFMIKIPSRPDPKRISDAGSGTISAITV